MTTEEGNKLIAEFIGGKLIDEYSYNQHWIFPNPEGMEENVGGKQYKLLFHSSWDWLMPVVEKIENLFDGWINVIIDGENCSIHNLNPQYKQFTAGMTKIESVWLAVVEFIKWYNNERK